MARGGKEVCGAAGTPAAVSHNIRPGNDVQRFGTRWRIMAVGQPDVYQSLGAMAPGLLTRVDLARPAALSGGKPFLTDLGNMDRLP
jgi:hypothetical protein